MQAQPQNLADALRNLGLLSGRINQLEIRRGPYTAAITNSFAGIVTRLAAVRAIVARQAGATADLLTLQNQIRTGAPTDAQILTLNNIFQLINPANLNRQLQALETEVRNLETAVGINRGAAPPGPSEAGALPAAPGAQSSLPFQFAGAQDLGQAR